jgi:chromosome segregation ATPase
MDLPTIDWHWLGSILGGGFVAAASRSLGIVRRMQALETRVDTQGQLMADQRDEISRLRKLVGKQDKELTEQRKQRYVLASRVTELERELKEERELRVRLQFEYAESLAMAERSHKTMPPPGSKTSR